MAATRSRASVPTLFAKTRLLLIETSRFIHSSPSSSSSADTSSMLVQKLLKAPISGIKRTLDSEFTSDSSDFPWATFLTSLHASAAPKANLVIEWKLEKLQKQSHKGQDDYARLLSLCQNIRNLPAAFMIFYSMEAEGCKSTSSVFNSLIATSLSSGNFVTAISLFEVMKNSDDYKPDSDTYDAFISAYSNLGDKSMTELWFSLRKASGFSPDAQTYGLVIFCCVNSRSFEDAEKFYQQMMLDGIQPNETVLHDMLLMYCEQRNSGTVDEFLKLLLDSGLQIDRIAASKVVTLYRELGLVQQLENLLMNLANSNQSSEVMSLVHCSIIRMYADTDRLDDVECSVGRMLRDGVAFSCNEDVEKVICCYFRREAYDRLDLFLERVGDSYRFSRSVYDLLGAGYRRAGLTEKLNLVVNDMKLAGIA